MGFRRTGTGIGAVAARVGAWFGDTWTRRPLPLDLAIYVCCLAYAITVALTNEFYGFRVWGNCAAAGYGLAAVHTCWALLRARSGKPLDRAPAPLPLRARVGRWSGSRWASVSVVAAFAMVLPLAILVVRRLTGGAWQPTPSAWSAQPEVWVIERSARLLLDTGTPYTDVTAAAGVPGVYDYTPYGPVMTVFGFPDALAGDGPLADALTDARLYFALVAVACVVVSMRLLGNPTVPVRAAQLALACPFTALTFAVAGPDLAILGLILLATVLAARGMPVGSATVIALACSAKLIVVPAVVVLAVFLRAAHGNGPCRRYAATVLTVCAAANLPVYLVDPTAFVEHVFRFPMGLAEVASPAASPLPGHLIATTGTAGHVAALILLCAAGLGVLIWLLRRGPVTASDAVLRIAVGLAAFTLLAPAARFGYLVYATVLLGAMVYLGSTEHRAGNGSDTAPRYGATGA